MNIKVVIKDNKLSFIDKRSEDLYKKILSVYNNTGKELYINIGEIERNTSEKQVSMYKALLMSGVEASGHTYEELEHILIQKFAPFYYEEDLCGEKIKRHKKVYGMTRSEFSSFIESSIAFMKEFFNVNFQ